jgi:hypothetical protein
MKIALLAGAGFSKWSCGLPLVSELFDFNIRIDNATEERRIIRLQKIYENWKGTHPKEYAEAFIQFAQGPTLRFNLVNWYITRRLTEPFIVTATRRYTWNINSYHAKRHEGIGKARSLIDALQSAGALNVITPNYDLVFEYSLTTRGFNYGILGEQIGFTPYPYPKPMRVTGPVSIAKIHGSISWNETNKFPDLRCGLTGKCLIVPPVPDKKQAAALKSQWLLAKQIVNECDSFVVFGFSFNEYDVAIRHFFMSQLNPKAKMIFVDVVDHRKKLVDIIASRTSSFIDACNPNLLNEISIGLKA